MYGRPNSPYCPVKLLNCLYQSLIPVCRVCGKGRGRVNVLENVMKSVIVMLLSEQNTLATLVSSIAKEMQLSYQYTNHCIRATASIVIT